MKLINEAAQDDKFNVQIGKVQSAIEKLLALAPEFGDGGIKPVGSQRSALTSAIADLTKIRAMMFNE